jgi:hypothetical protein
MPLFLWAVAIGWSLEFRIVACPFLENWTSQPLSVRMLIDNRLVLIAEAYNTSVSWIRRFLEASGTVPMPIAGTILSSPIRTFIGFGSRRIFRKAPLLLQICLVAPESRCYAFQKELPLIFGIVV